MKQPKLKFKWKKWKNDYQNWYGRWNKERKEWLSKLTWQSLAGLGWGSDQVHCQGGGRLTTLHCSSLWLVKSQNTPLWLVVTFKWPFLWQCQGGTMRHGHSWSHNIGKHSLINSSKIFPNLLLVTHSAALILYKYWEWRTGVPLSV